MLLWSVASRDEKGSDLNVRDLSTGAKIGSCLTNARPVSGSRASNHRSPLGTAVNLSRPNSHPEFCSMLYPLQVRIARGPLDDSPRGLFLLAFELLDKCSKTRGMGATRDPRIRAPTSALRLQRILASCGRTPAIRLPPRNWRSPWERPAIRSAIMACGGITPARTATMRRSAGRISRDAFREAACRGAGDIRNP